MKKSYKIDFQSKIETNIYPLIIRFVGDLYIYDFSQIGDNKVVRLFALVFSNRYGNFGVSARERSFNQIKAFLSFLMKESISTPTDIEPLLLVKYARHLDSLNYALNTKYRHYNNLELLFKEIFILKNSPVVEFILPSNPFKNANSESARPSKINIANIDELINICKTDAKQIMNDFYYGQKVIKDNLFEIPKPKKLEEAIYYFHKTERYIPITSKTTDLGKSLLRRYGGVKSLSKYLHPTIETLVPFYILLLFELAANSDALRQIKVDCLTDDMLLDTRAMIQWEKSRANQIQKRSVLKKTSLGAYEIINFLKLFTSPIREKFKENEKQYLFICRGDSDKNELLFPHRRSLEKGIKQFIKEKKLSFNFNPSDIRPSVLTELYKKRGDIISVSKLANHRNLDTTLSYVVDPEIEQNNQKEIALIQDKLFMFEKVEKELVSLTSAEISWADGYNCKQPIIDKKLCVNWMVELTNPDLIIPNNVKYLARILKLKMSILEQKNQITNEKYILLYSPVIILIDYEILPRFSSGLLKEAEDILESISTPSLEGY